MSGPSQLSTDNILRFLQLRNDPVSLEELSRLLHVRKNNRRALLQMLAKLKKRGLVEELTHGRFLLRGNQRKTASVSSPAPEKISQHKASSRDEISGRLVHHADGYGFVVPDV